MKRSYWQDWEEQLLREHCGTLSIEEVAKKLPHRTEKAVHLKAFKLGLIPGRNTWTEAEDQILRDNFPQKTVRQISEMLHKRSIDAIKHRISKIGISGEQWACKYSANRGFFSEPNALNCYWAGLIAADGCVIKSQKTCSTKTLKIQIIAGDGYLLEQFARDAEFTGSVRILKPKDSVIRGRRTKTGAMAEIAISCSQDWFMDLERNFSITPRKSLTLKPPNTLNRDCSLAFIKGFLDGDGCVHVNRSGYMSFSFYGTVECLTWIKSVCDEVAPHYTDEWRTKKRHLAGITYSGTVHVYNIGGHRAEQLAREILKLNIPGMKRKWDKVQQHLAEKSAKLEDRRTTVQVHIFDSSRVYLGRLCKRGHDYEETGKSLRRVGHGSCVKCVQENRGIEKPRVPTSYWLELTSKLYPQLENAPYYLGELCKNKHEYEQSGYSLRYKTSRGCVGCSNMRFLSRRSTNS